MFKPISLNNLPPLVSFITRKLLNQAAQTTQGFPLVFPDFHFPWLFQHCLIVPRCVFFALCLYYPPEFWGLIPRRLLGLGNAKCILSKALTKTHWQPLDAAFYFRFLRFGHGSLWLANPLWFSRVSPPGNPSQLSHKPIKLWAAYAFCICQLSRIWQMCSSKQASSPPTPPWIPQNQTYIYKHTRWP